MVGHTLFKNLNDRGNPIDSVGGLFSDVLFWPLRNGYATCDRWLILNEC